MTNERNAEEGRISDPIPIPDPDRNEREAWRAAGMRNSRGNVQLTNGDILTPEGKDLRNLGPMPPLKS